MNGLLSSKRRLLLGLAGVAAVLPRALPAASSRPLAAFLALGFAANAEQPPRRIVWAHALPDDETRKLLGDPRDRIRGFLKERGLVEGQHITLQFEVFPRGDAPSPADWLDRIVDVRPDVVVMQPHMPTLQALAARTRDIPIVFYNLGRDPVDMGLVESLQRPGRNITGTILGVEDSEMQHWQILKEFVPTMRRGGVLMVRENFEEMTAMAARGDRAMDAARKSYQENKRAVAAALGIEIVDVLIPRDATRGQIAALIAKAQPQAVAVYMGVTLDLLAALKESRIPAMGISFRSVRRGLLVGSSFDHTEGERYAARTVQKILGGESPANIPVYRLTPFVYAVNLATAREIGIDVPGSVLMRALEVYP